MASVSRTPLLPEVNPINPVWSTALVSSVAIACLNAFQYGYHMAELNAPESLIREEMDFNDSQVGLVTAIFSIGGLIASTLASNLSVQKGLKTGFLVTCVFYMIGSVLESSALTYAQMLAGRFVSGLGGGLSLVFVPLYVNEVSPVAIRGLLGSMTQVSVNMGILFTQCLAIKWSTRALWRSILWMGVFVGTLTLLLTIVFLPESPRWLLSRNETQALRTLSKLRNDNLAVAEAELDNWRDEQREHEDKSVSLHTYLTDKSYRNSVIVATAIMVGQQFAGINAVIFYGVKILSGLFPNWAIALNCLISVGNALITFVCSLFLDSVGRKPMLLASISVMCVCLVAVSIGVLAGSATLTVVGIFSYVASFAVGVGPIPILIVSEVSQPEVKDVAQSWTMDCNWISVFVVGAAFPVLNRVLGGYTYLIFAAVCLAFGIFIKRFVPETKGKQTYSEVWGDKAGNLD